MVNSQFSGAQWQAREKKKSQFLACFTALTSNCCQNFYRHQGTESKRQKQIRKTMKMSYSERVLFANTPYHAIVH